MRFRLPLTIAALAIAALPQAGASCRREGRRKGSADKCRGIDMLAETAAKDPQTYTRIMAEAAATKNAGAILWKIEKEGRPASYLFGTVHLTDERVTNLRPPSRRLSTRRRSLRSRFPTCRRTPPRR